METTTAPDIHDELDELRRQVADLHARDELNTLVLRLGRTLDDGRFEEMSQLFTEDASARTPGGAVEGRTALIAQASRNHIARDRIQHLFGNVHVDLAGDEATVRAEALITFAEGDKPTTPHLTIGEHYQLGARRTAEGWRLTRVETSPVWYTGTLPSSTREPDA